MTHTIQKKIYYHDTDCGGVVYYANYLNFFEEGRTEHLAQCGVDLKTLSAQGTWFVVKRVEVNYKGPARYADTIQVITQISKIRNVSLEYEQRIMRDTETLVEAKTVLVCVDASFKPAAINEKILNLIQL
jgi:acyl-CoA thioester hydrolase